MDIDWKKLEEAVKMAGSRTIAPYHFATVTKNSWHRALAVLQRYARNGAIEELQRSRFRVPPAKLVRLGAAAEKWDKFPAGEAASELSHAYCDLNH